MFRHFSRPLLDCRFFSSFVAGARAGQCVNLTALHGPYAQSFDSQPPGTRARLPSGWFMLESGNKRKCDCTRRYGLVKCWW